MKLDLIRVINKYIEFIIIVIVITITYVLVSNYITTTNMLDRIKHSKDNIEKIKGEVIEFDKKKQANSINIDDVNRQYELYCQSVREYNKSNSRQLRTSCN